MKNSKKILVKLCREYMLDYAEFSIIANLSYLILKGIFNFPSRICLLSVFSLMFILLRFKK